MLIPLFFLLTLPKVLFYVILSFQNKKRIRTASGPQGHNVLHRACRRILADSDNSDGVQASVTVLQERERKGGKEIMIEQD